MLRCYVQNNNNDNDNSSNANSNNNNNSNSNNDNNVLLLLLFSFRCYVQKRAPGGRRAAAAGGEAFRAYPLSD